MIREDKWEVYKNLLFLFGYQVAGFTMILGFFFVLLFFAFKLGLI